MNIFDVVMNKTITRRFSVSNLFSENDLWLIWSASCFLIETQRFSSFNWLINLFKAANFPFKLVKLSDKSDIT